MYWYNICRSVGLRLISAIAPALAIVAVVVGCGPGFPVAEYSDFGCPTGASFNWTHAGDVIIDMKPADHPFAYREGLSIEEFTSPTGHDGEVLVHYPKGEKLMRLLAYEVSEADSDMLFEWKVAQSGQVMQEMSARIVPGPPVRVFIDGREIDAEHAYDNSMPQ